ncbi:MAG: ribonuclease R [Coprococcus sp.]|nr:ribonuclease R [Coprococcus sp.]
MSAEILRKDRKENIYNLICDETYKPLKFKELCYLLQVPYEAREELHEILEELLDEGRIVRTNKGKYQKMGEGVYKGKFISNKKGFGFVRVEGMTEDFFIPERKTGGAYHDDTVLIQVSGTPYGKRTEASVIKVLERGLKRIVGIYEQNKSFGFVIPDNRRIDGDIFVSKKNSMGAVTGHKVVIEILSYGDKTKSAEGRVIEILGHINDPETDVLSVVRELDIPVDFPDEVMSYVNGIPDTVSSKEMAGRADLRHLTTVTIDGEDAKDLDDAITLYEEDGMYKLGVHIADVTNYVRENSPLDKEAFKRGTSCYLVDRVIPMLPHKLSNGICSLNEGQDRLALSCLMEIDNRGRIVSHKICETVINVDRRMTYTSVSAIVEDENEEEIEKYKELVPMFRLMLKVSDLLRENRMERGSIDFDFDESKIMIGDDGMVSYVGAYERRRSNGIIEDFMLAANETIAEDYFWQELPFEYRVHEAPDAEKVKQLAVLISKFGFYFKTSKENIHPKEFQKLLHKIEGEDCESLISRMTLRTMRQAKYSTECTGHFGLACKYYCHFTSPIRRYPDLQIHRIIKDNIHGRLDEKRISHYEAILSKVADDNSKKERRAEEAEREVEKLKKVEYMSAHKGELFEGIISGVTNRGIYVELPNTIEGLVSVSNMYDDYYCFSQEEYAMIGQETGKKYAIGDKIKVKVKGTDKITRTIDFVISYEGDELVGERKRKQNNRKQ